MIFAGFVFVNRYLNWHIDRLNNEDRLLNHRMAILDFFVLG